jgi:hypothetical protein
VCGFGGDLGCSLEGEELDSSCSSSIEWAMRTVTFHLRLFLRELAGTVSCSTARVRTLRISVLFMVAELSDRKSIPFSGTWIQIGENVENSTYFVILFRDTKLSGFGPLGIPLKLLFRSSMTHLVIIRAFRAIEIEHSSQPSAQVFTRNMAFKTLPRRLASG